MKFRNRPDILISLIAAKARLELFTFITKQKLSADSHPLRKNRCVRFGFGGGTVLVACRGDQVSFYTTFKFKSGIWLSAAAKTIALDRAFTY